MPTTSDKQEKGASRARKRDVVDLSDLTPAEVDHLVERVNSELAGRDHKEKARHFLRLLDEHRGRQTFPTGQGRSRKDYLAPYYAKIRTLPADWDGYVQSEARKVGDKLLEVGIDSGYLDQYAVADSDYLRHLTGSGNRVIYHQYAGQPEHGAELLRRLREQGLEVPYEVTQVATAVHHPHDWQPERHIKVDTQGKHPVGRALLHALVFKPKDSRQAHDLIDALARHGHAKAEEPVEGAWQHPDIRTGFPHPSLKPHVLNTVEAGGKHVMLLKEEGIRGFRTHEVHLSDRVAGVSKALPVYWVDNRRFALLLHPQLSKCARSDDAALELVGARMAGPGEWAPCWEEADGIAYLVSGDLLGRGPMLLKSTEVAGRTSELPLPIWARFLEQHNHLQRCLKACAKVHALPDLSNTELVAAPRERSAPPRRLALQLSDLGAMWHALGASAAPLMRSCPAAVERFGMDIGPVAYDSYVASVNGLDRGHALSEQETRALHCGVREALKAVGLRPAVALIVVPSG